MLSLINNDIKCPAISGAVWEAREVTTPFKGLPGEEGTPLKF